VTLTYQLIGTDDLDRVAAFLRAHDWPFHTGELDPDRNAARHVGDDVRAHWALDGSERVGLVRVDDVRDGPMLDLRVAAPRRGRGVGGAMLRWATADVFTTTAATRFEATTRVDNEAMRRAFRRAGWVKEAHYRRAWPTDDGPVDSVGYAVLREDWETGGITPVDFDDES
jgi:GNAT superfamily N-acetyltransferase